MTTQARKKMDELLDALETKNRRLTDDLEAMDLDSKSLWDEVNALKVANAELVKAAEYARRRFELLAIDDEDRKALSALRDALDKVKQ